MAEYRFERECRTPHSEAYLIIAEDERVGRVDLHFTPSIVYATLCVNEKMAADDIQDLIDSVDEELVWSADIARDDFIVTVFQGREAGIFSDEEFDEEDEEEEEGK